MESYTALWAGISCRHIDMCVSPFIFTSAAVGCVVSGGHLTQSLSWIYSKNPAGNGQCVVLHGFTLYRVKA